MTKSVCIQRFLNIGLFTIFNTEGRKKNVAFLMKGDGFLVPLQPFVNFKKPNSKKRWAVHITYGK